jgi:four helix bundle protein
MAAVRSYRDLIAWQKAMDYAVMVHQESARFPKDEIYGLRGQIRESSVSVPSNIAEGHGRRSTKEFRRFLSISYGSLCEAQTQTLLAERFSYWDNSTTERIIRLGEEVGRLINGLRNSIKRS